MQVSIICSGYVGTTVATCFANLGHNVINIDINDAVVETINTRSPPIHGEGLPELVATHAGDESTERLLCHSRP